MNTTATFRYPGVGPFTEEYSTLFFGREEEGAALNRLLGRVPQVLLYGKSGTGKSSLIQASIIPHWRERRQIVEVRFAANIAGHATLLEILLKALPPIQPHSLIGQIFAGQDGLWLRLKAMQSVHKNVQRPSVLFIFDQFEELFSFPSGQVAEFKHEMAEAFYEEIPARYREIVQSRWGGLEEREQDMLVEDLDPKLLVSIREDRLSLINQLGDALPDLRQNYSMLTALNRNKARSAILMPAAQHGAYVSSPFEISNAAVEAILDRLTENGQEVEPTLLQIICRQIESEIIAVPGKTQIDLKDLPPLGDLLRGFYEGVLSRLPETMRLPTQVFVEDELIQDGWRIPVAEQKCLSKIPASSLQYLVSAHLIRAERNSVGGKSYELSHDILIGPISVVRREREKVTMERQRQALEEELRSDLQKSKLERNRANRRLRITIFALLGTVVGIVFALVSLSIAIDNSKEAERQRLIAVAQGRELDSLYASLKLQHTELSQLKDSIQAMYVDELIAAAYRFKIYGGIQLAIRKLRDAEQIDPTRVDVQDSLNVYQAILRVPSPYRRPSPP